MEKTLYIVDYQKDFVGGYSEYEKAVKAVKALQSIMNTPNILVLAVDSH